MNSDLALFTAPGRRYCLFEAKMHYTTIGGARMWDDILEIVLEGILGISIDAAGHKGKGILIGLATLVWLAMIVLLLWVGIAEVDITLIGIGIVLLAALAFWLYVKVKKYCKVRK